MADARLAQTVAQLAQAVEAMGERLAALEAARADLERRAEVVGAASKAWKPLMRIQGDLLLSSEAGTTCRVPLSVCRTLAAGKALDLDVRESGADVELVDHAGRVVASLPRVALLALPRLLSSPETTQLMRLGVHVQPGQTVRTGGTRCPGATRQRHHRP